MATTKDVAAATSSARFIVRAPLVAMLPPESHSGTDRGTVFPLPRACATARRYAGSRRTNCRTRRRRRPAAASGRSCPATSSLAPLSKRYCTTLFAPRYAAACIAVSPVSATKFTSAPSSSTSILAASSTCSSPARSWFDAHAMPATSISGVMLSGVLIFGSAPFSSSSRITSISACLAAARNGVKPT